MPERETATEAPESAAPETPKRTRFRGENDPLLETAEVVYDSKLKFPPKKTDFKHEHHYFVFRAVTSEASAIKFRELAEEAKTLGSSAERAKAKKLKRFLSEAELIKADLRKELGDEAFDKIMLAMTGKTA